MTRDGCITPVSTTWCSCGTVYSDKKKIPIERATSTCRVSVEVFAGATISVNQRIGEEKGNGEDKHEEFH